MALHLSVPREVEQLAEAGLGGQHLLFEGAHVIFQRGDLDLHAEGLALVGARGFDPRRNRALELTEVADHLALEGESLGDVPELQQGGLGGEDAIPDDLLEGVTREIHLAADQVGLQREDSRRRQVHRHRVAVQRRAGARREGAQEAAVLGRESLDVGDLGKAMDRGLESAPRGRNTAVACEDQHADLLEAHPPGESEAQGLLVPSQLHEGPVISATQVPERDESGAIAQHLIDAVLRALHLPEQVHRKRPCRRARRWCRGESGRLNAVRDDQSRSRWRRSLGLHLGERGAASSGAACLERQGAEDGDAEARDHLSSSPRRVRFGSAASTPSRNSPSGRPTLRSRSATVC